MEIDWTTGALLFGIHMALVATVIAMVWHGPLSQQQRAKEKVREYTNKK
tara:strand:+ start:840 stop:986 length:147 start_codon:yes stop_codon:yes gene_type:complete